ncbi:3-dehydro-L-gulonate 2-dehydrogenase [Granulicella sp. S156]|uniref:3-dehydro-L-gulonate 2-dehydrogenase n=1 Tax=Granulicella sp. S156 TaxID=1747224 RepID=UPI00131C5053|nr:3-dehydro-L-gulonate 2-dehydrogenase [Granulicella sp. S156]
MVRIPFDELRSILERVFLHLGLEPERAALSARLTAETDRDGVRTHGIARLPRFAEMVRNGSIDPLAQPECLASFGALERWTGHRGPGNLAAHTAMARAVALAKTHGLGAVALGDTTHWQRGGAFGWQAAEAGFAALCWTNTLPNLPPWGATTPALGNNPLVLAIPHTSAKQSNPIVLDIAMSQYSYGTLAAYRERGQLLPFAGGFDEQGELTRDPAAIERSQRALPIGLWKGSGLSFVLDVLAAMLAGGRSSHQIDADPLKEVGQSQVFLAIAPQSLASMEELNAIAQGAIDALHSATPVEPGKPARYPGEGTLATRKESLRLGVAVDEAQWEKIQELATIGD